MKTLQQLFITLLSCLLVFNVLAAGESADSLPDFGDVSGTIMTPVEEQRLGKAFMRYVRASQKVLDDPLLEDYIQELGKNLVANSDAQGSEFHFFLIDDPVINAFAGPAGYIGINTGLILTTETESELAAVLSHEIAHVTQKHLVRTWHAASKLSLGQAAVMAAALVLGATVGGDAAMAAAMGGQASLIQQQINFTRANEKEADRVGINVLADSGFEPRAMPTFFSRMGRANQIYSSELPEFLRTHPVTNSRIADAQGRAEQYSYRHHEENLRYQLARTRLRLQNFDNQKSALKHFQLTLEDGRYRSEAANRYGLVLALIENEQLDKAQQEMTKLLREYPTTVEFIVTDAKIKALANDTPSAIASLQTSVNLLPGNYPLHVTLAEMLLGQKQAEDAYNISKQLVSSRPEDSRAFQLLARAAAESGRKTEGHEYLSAYYYLIGSPEAAMLQLEIALREDKLNFYDASRIESKLKNIKAEVEDLKKKQNKKTP